MLTRLKYVKMWVTSFLNTLCYNQIHFSFQPALLRFDPSFIFIKAITYLLEYLPRQLQLLSEISDDIIWDITQHWSCWRMCNIIEKTMWGLRFYFPLPCYCYYQLIFCWLWDSHNSSEDMVLSSKHCYENQQSSWSSFSSTIFPIRYKSASIIGKHVRFSKFFEIFKIYYFIHNG